MSRRFSSKNTYDIAPTQISFFALFSTYLIAGQLTTPLFGYMVYVPKTITCAIVMDKIQCFVHGQKIGEGVLHRQAETIVAGYDAFESPTDFFMTFYNSYTYHKYIEQRMKQILSH